MPASRRRSRRRVSLQVDYVRRSWGNLTAMVNDALTAADFDTFVYNVPQDPRLPGGGGYGLTFRDVKPASVQQIRNRLTFANEVGGAYNKFNGVDVTVNARLRDVTLQGGTSTGNVVEDSCGVVTENPEYYIFGPWGGTGGFLDTFLGGIGQWPQQFCHRESGWKTNIKGLASYTVPKIDVLVSGTFKSLPYPGNEFPSVQSQSLGGQVLAFNIPGVVDHVLEPAVRQRTGRPVPEHRRARQVVRRSSERDRSPVRQDSAGTARHRTLINFDVYNLFNSNTTEVYSGVTRLRAHRGQRISIRCRSCRRGSSRSARSSISD